jgi:hypothetical protein
LVYSFQMLVDEPTLFLYSYLCNFCAHILDRFPEVAELLHVCWLEIRGKINTLALSPNTLYVTYLVFKMINAYGFEYYPVELSVDIKGGQSSTKIVCLADPNARRRHRSRIIVTEPNRVLRLQRPNVRSDGWLEIEMGEFFSGLEDEEVQMSVIDIKGGHWKRGFFVEGIEVRPKEDNNQYKLNYGRVLCLGW